MTDAPELTSALVLDAWSGARLLEPSVSAQHVAGALVGRAYTVRHSRDDNLALHHAVTRAPAGSVIVSATGYRGQTGIWGALLTAAARRRGIAGLVTDGCVRDVAEIQRTDFGVFAAGRDPRKARKEDPGEHGVALRIAGVEIASGDLIVADPEGVVAIADAEAAPAVEAARTLARREVELLSQIQAGALTLDVLGLPADPPTHSPGEAG